MARIRSLKPSFFGSRTIAPLGYSARLLALALLTFVDDEGRGKDDPHLIKAHAWPLDDDMTTGLVERDMVALAKVGFTVRYQVRGGARFFAVAKWLDHQRISHPTPSKLPPPPRSGNIRERSGATPEGSRSAPESFRLEGKGKERKGIRKSADADPSEMFVKAFEAYPRRPNNNRLKALRAWQARVVDGVSEEAMLAGTVAYCGYVAREQVAPQFVKLAATFYGPDRHWETDYGTAPSGMVQVYDEHNNFTPEYLRAVGVS